MFQKAGKLTDRAQTLLVQHKAGRTVTPALSMILPPKQVALPADRMEEDEHKVLSEEGFEKCRAEVEALEKRLGIFDLVHFRG